MHIGVAGPISLSMLADHLPAGTTIPKGYPFPLIAQYVKGLLAKGHWVTVFTLCSETQAPLFIQGDRLSLSVTPMRSKRWWLDLQQWEIGGLREAMKAHPVEVMHAHWTYEFPRAAHWAGIPTLVTAHDSPWRILRLNLPAPGRWIRLSRHVHALRVLRDAQALTVVSPYIEDELRRDFAISCPVKVVANGIEGNQLHSSRRKPDPGQIPVLMAVFSGGFSGIKNGPVLLNACRLLQERGRSFRLLLLGAGCQPGSEAERFLESRGWVLPATFLGPQPHVEVLRIMREEANLLIHPSLEESFGMVVLEAMSRGLPVLGGTASGAVPWLLGYGEAGYLADVTRAEALAQAIDSALADPRAAESKGARGLARSRQEFSLQRMAEAYENLLVGLRPGQP